MKQKIIEIIEEEVEKVTVDNGIELRDIVPDLYEKIELAAESLVKLYHLHGVTNWVAIDESLPNEHQDVLVYYYANRDSRHFPDNQFMKGTSFYDDKFECNEEVTHWAALPEPPCL